MEYITSAASILRSGGMAIDVSMLWPLFHVCRLSAVLYMGCPASYALDAERSPQGLKKTAKGYLI